MKRCTDCYVPQRIKFEDSSELSLVQNSSNICLLDRHKMRGQTSRIYSLWSWYFVLMKLLNTINCDISLIFLFQVTYFNVSLHFPVSIIVILVYCRYTLYMQILEFLFTLFAAFSTQLIKSMSVSGSLSHVTDPEWQEHRQVHVWERLH